jgi:hypothetical protein
VVWDLEDSGLDHTFVRPSGYFSDMGAVLDMAKLAFDVLGKPSKVTVIPL